MDHLGHTDGGHVGVEINGIDSSGAALGVAIRSGKGEEVGIIVDVFLWRSFPPRPDSGFSILLPYYLVGGIFHCWIVPAFVHFTTWAFNGLEGNLLNRPAIHVFVDIIGVADEFSVEVADSLGSIPVL